MVRLADAIGSAQSLPDIYDAALAGIQHATGIDRASILLFDADGVMRFKAWAGLSDAYRTAVEGHTPWSFGDPPPDPLVVSDVQADPSLADYRATFQQEDIRALAFVPIVSERQVIGKFMLYRREPHHFADGELSDALAIGYQIGFAVQRMRDEREAAERHLQMLFALDAAQMGTWNWDVGTPAVRWSENLERIHGLPAGTFTGEFASYVREVHPDDREHVLASLDAALTKGTPHDVEYRIVSPEGTVRWVHGKGRVELDAEGSAVRMCGVCMDITARKRADAHIEQALREEAALRERLNRLTQGAQRLLSSLATDSVIEEVIALAESVVAAHAYAVWRRHGDFWTVKASRGVSEPFVAPVKHESIIAFDAPIIAEDVQAAESIAASRRAQYAREGIVSVVSIPLAIRGEPGGSIVFYYRSPHRPTEIELHVATALGQLAAAAISNADLYAQQQRLWHEAEHAQIRSAFLAEASVLLASLDHERNLQRLAHLAVPRLGDWCAVDLLAGSQEIARLAVAHVDESRVALAHEIHRQYPPQLTDTSGVGFVVRTGTPQLFPDVRENPVREVKEPGHRRLVRELNLQSVMIVPLTAGRRTFGAISFATTTAARHYAEADLDFAMELAGRAALAIENARLFEEARKANRLKDEFLATLSHELRTPLNVILGRTRRLAEAAGDPAAVRQAAQTIDRNAQTLGRLVEDLLDVSRFTLGQVTLDLRAVDLAAIVQTVAASLEPTARAKGVRLQARCRGDVLGLSGDPTRLQQVVWNLVTNAIKFTPEGGEVSVALERNGPQAVLTVSDTGSGITPEFLPHVFEMFRQGESTPSRQHGGLGLGLSIVRRLVELHGGDVTAASGGPGLGATFTVALPCSMNVDGMGNGNEQVTT